jgi:hypothetical protein
MKRTALVCVRNPEVGSVSCNALSTLRYRVSSTSHSIEATSAIVTTPPDVLIMSSDLAAALLPLVDESTFVVVVGERPAFAMAGETGVPISQCIQLPATRADFVNALSWAATKPICI